MSDNVYKELLEVMKKRGGEYAGMDIPEFFAMVEELFTPEEAAVNNAMPRGPFQAKDLAEAMGRETSEMEAVLEAMADKGLCGAVSMGETTYYQGVRFMPGILEFQFMPGKINDRAKRIAKLIHAYENTFDANKEKSDFEFPSYRVITVDRTVEGGNTIHTYDQVKSVIDKNDDIAVTTCYCRHGALLRGEDTHDMPMEVCMQFGMNAQFALQRMGARKLTREEALDVLKQSEEAGLIHMSQNMTDGFDFVCNCDRWHCVPLKNVMSKPKPGFFFNSGFEPKVDADLCTACETCVDRCPPVALGLGDDDVPVVNLDLCFGCAVCATGCPTEAITMVNKPDFPVPPESPKALKQAIIASREQA